MNAEKNKAVVRAYAEAFSKGDFDSIAEMCTPDVVIQGVLGKGGLDVIMPIWNELHHAFALRLEVQELLAEGDQVAARYRESGTFRNPFRGKEPTGKSYSLIAMEWFHMKDGRIAERWGARDYNSMLRQIEAD